MTTEFVDRDKAVADATRAVGLLNTSDEAKVEAWFAMQAVADQVGPSSNVGVRHIRWEAAGQPGRYTGNHARYDLAATCVEGRLRQFMRAPDSLDEARYPENLQSAVAVLERKIEELGGLVKPDKRPQGVGAALREAVCASPEGLRWYEARKCAKDLLGAMVQVADAYGREGVYAPASLGAHRLFVAFDDRAQLIRDYPRTPAARAKCLALRGGAQIEPEYATKVPGRYVSQLSVRAGVAPTEARAILRALLNGRSKTKMIRAVNEAARMVEQDGPLRVAA